MIRHLSHEATASIHTMRLVLDTNRSAAVRRAVCSTKGLEDVGIAVVAAAVSQSTTASTTTAVAAAAASTTTAPATAAPHDVHRCLVPVLMAMTHTPKAQAMQVS